LLCCLPNITNDTALKVWATTLTMTVSPRSSYSLPVKKLTRWVERL